MLKQISIYTENQKGAFQQITQILFQNGILIYGVNLSESQEYGTIRMLVDDPVRTFQVLTEVGYACKMADILGVELKNEVGQMNSLLKAMKKANISADYLYLAFSPREPNPLLVVHTTDIHEVEDVLRKRGFLCL